MKHLTILLIFTSLTFACKSKKPVTNSSTPSPETANSLIRDCPEEMIVNSMPSSDTKKDGKRSSYYIYKGERKEVYEFDTVWVKKNCTVTVTQVQ